jgi:cytochrome c-type biogenesis protein CcmH/NrfG
MKSQSFVSWVIVFGVGFLTGVVFSAWRLDFGTGPKETLQRAAPAPTQMPSKERAAALERMLAANPNDVSTIVRVANGYFDLGNYPKAAETYEKAVALDPKNADVITDLGVCLRRMKKPEQAVAKFREALKINPGHAVALFNLGLVLRDDMKNLPEALRTWETFLQKAGNAPHAVMIRPWVKQLREKLNVQKPQAKEEKTRQRSGE